MDLGPHLTILFSSEKPLLDTPKESNLCPVSSSVMQPPLDEPLDMSMKTRKTQRVVINHDVDGGLEEHFRRSLCKEFYSDVDAAGGKSYLKPWSCSFPRGTMR